MQRTVQLLAVTYYLEFSRVVLRAGNSAISQVIARFHTYPTVALLLCKQFIVIYIEIKTVRESARGYRSRGDHKNIFRRFPG